MMPVTVRVNNVRVLTNQFDRLAAQVSGRRVSRLLQETLHIPHDYAVAEMHKPKSGVQYVSLPVRSSAAGEAPARQTGDLIAALYIAPLTVGRHEAVVAFGGDARRAIQVLHEVGLGHSAPRPYLRAAVTATFGQMRRAVLRDLKRQVLRRV